MHEHAIAGFRHHQTPACSLALARTPFFFYMERLRTSRIHVYGFIIILLLLVQATAAATSRCPAQQAAALLRLKRSFHHHHQPLLLPSWRAATDCCLWEGVSCDAAASGVVVTALDLGGHGVHSPGGLDGAALFQLTSLRRLSLAGNDFGGRGSRRPGSRGSPRSPTSTSPTPASPARYPSASAA